LYLNYLRASAPPPILNGGVLNLTTRYNNDADFSISVKMIISLVFVKIKDLDFAVDLLV